MTDVLAFDWGINVVGVLDINRNIYTPYYYLEMRKGAERIVSTPGIIVSFNGKRRDLLELSKLLGFDAESDMKIQGEHDDMQEIISMIRWPPDPGTAPILGENLISTYEFYFGDGPIKSPSNLSDEYIIGNWRDCYMTAELWKKWKKNEIK